jgi:hypothetical protein
MIGRSEAVHSVTIAITRGQRWRMRAAEVEPDVLMGLV